MRKYLLLLASTLALGFCENSWASFDEGVEAFERGDFKVSVKPLLEASQNGDTRAPFYLKYLFLDKKFLDVSLLDPKDQKHVSELPQYMPYLPEMGQGQATLETSLSYLSFMGLLPGQEKPSEELRKKEFRSVANDTAHPAWFTHRFIVLNKMLKIYGESIKKLIDNYTRAAEYGNLQALVELRKLKRISSSHLQDLTVLQGTECQSKSPGVAELFLAKFYKKDTAHKTYGKFQQDLRKAHYLKLKAALLGHKDAQYEFGNTLLERGEQNKQQLKIEQAKWYYLAARKGKVLALYHAGRSFAYGINGFPQDDVQAAPFLTKYLNETKGEKSTDRGEAALIIGSLYRKGGGGLEKNDKLTREHYEIGAEYEIPRSLYLLAHMYWDGEGGPQDKSKALRLYERAADKNDRSAQAELGILYYKGHEDLVSRNFQKAYTYLYSAVTPKAQSNVEARVDIEAQDQAEAQFLLYFIIKDGLHGQKPDPELALTYLEASANQDHTKACFYMAEHLIRSSSEDVKRISSLIQKAAQDESLPEAKPMLGVCCLEGYGVIEKDESRGLSYLFEAEKADIPQAFLNLGYTYAKGLYNQTQDDGKARAYFEKVKGIYPEALNELGNFQEQGRGGFKASFKEAIPFYEEAYQKGCAVAGYNLARALLKGDPSKENQQKALDLFETVAKEIGDPDATYQAGMCHLRKGREEHTKGNLDQARSHFWASRAYLEKAYNKNVKGAAHDLGVLLYTYSSESEKLRGKKLILESAEEGIAISQFVYALLLHLEDSLNNKTTVKEWMTKAADQGFSGAKFALTCLNSLKPLHQEVVTSLVEGDLEKAKETRVQSIASPQGKNSSEIDKKLKKSISQKKDPESKKRRNEKKLEKFLDPLSKKGNTIDSFLKIISNYVNNEGDKIENHSGGSGINITTTSKSGEQHHLSFHMPHKSGQSSNAQLDQGRLHSFTDLVKDITK